MGPTPDPPYSQPQFRFPPSPPSSGNVTAACSPRIPLLSVDDPEIAEKIYASASSYRQPHSLTPADDSHSDSEGYNTETTGGTSLRPCRATPTHRASVLPPYPLRTPSIPVRPRSRTPSSKSSNSTSSESGRGDDAETHPGAGKGRKVAATLQLFKETAPHEDLAPSNSSSRSGSSRRPLPFREAGDAEPQFEFVKRSDWPDRESAAGRRELSSLGFERSKGRDDSANDRSFHDIPQWRLDALTSTRGRRLERSVDNETNVADQVSSFKRQHSYVFPPSPSPSRSPSNRLHLPSLDESPFDLPSDSSFSPISSDIPFPDRPDTPCSVNDDAAHSLLPSESPWSTDDESAYDDSASAASVSTSSTSFHQSTHSDTPSTKPLENDDGRHDHLPYALSDDEDLKADLRPSRFDGSKNSLPHIPLRPFRNQVGGHSAIYKFTKQAVCKPLVSRENLFYEAVEREAPPLLDFIPRYLGVMLVSYRRVPDSGQPDAQSLSPKDPASTPSSSSASPPDYTIVRQSIAGNGPDPAADPIDHTVEGTELPEVVLERNRHIIPEWLLHGKRNRSLSYSNLKGSVIARRRLGETHLHRGTASTPDLPNLPDLSTPSNRPSPLAAFSNLSSEVEAPTPVNSPSHGPRPFLSSLGGRPSANRFDHSPDSDDEAVGRPAPQSFRSERVLSVPGSPWFGGTGSTVVNTKLKDHVFNSVLRRFRKRRPRRSGPCSLPIDGDVADIECEISESPALSSPSASRTPRPLFRSSDQDSSGCHTQIASLTKQSLFSHAKEEGTHVRGDTSKDMGIFDIDLDHGDEDDTRDMCTWDRPRLSPLLRSIPASRLLTTPPALPRNHPFETHDIHEAGEIEPGITRQNHFILMEDLTGRLKHPCVMDVKMGTRQYGMDATAAKKKSQRKKCDRTTSRPLGVRVCGMQIWNNITQSYITQDKYHGREVRADEFDSVLESFLFDGERLLAYQIPVLLQKLYALARIINRLKGFRFYGCSLLLIYDGDRESQEVFRSSILEQPWSRTQRGESLERRSESQARSSDKAPLRRSHSEDLLVGPVARRQSRRKKRGEINVRVVDFAHTTTGRDWLPYPELEPKTHTDCAQGYDAETDPESGLIYARFPPHYPDQPDCGFLFGLKNLAVALEEIWNRERIRRIKASRDDPCLTKCQLPPLPTDGKEIFDKIFGNSGDSDSGYMST